MDYDKMKKIAISRLSGAPKPEDQESIDFLSEFEKDIELAEENGWSIELPFEIMEED